MVDQGTSRMSLHVAITGLGFFFASTLEHAGLMARNQRRPLLFFVISPLPVKATGSDILLQAIARHRRPVTVLTYFCPIDQMKDCTSIRSRGSRPSSSRLVRM